MNVFYFSAGVSWCYCGSKWKLARTGVFATTIQNTMTSEQQKTLKIYAILSSVLIAGTAVVYQEPTEELVWTSRSEVLSHQRVKIMVGVFCNCKATAVFLRDIASSMLGWFQHASLEMFLFLASKRQNRTRPDYLKAVCELFCFLGGLPRFIRWSIRPQFQFCGISFLGRAPTHRGANSR